MASIEEIKAKTWNGEHLGRLGAVNQHYQKYKEDPQLELVRFASTVYSARDDLGEQEVRKWFRPLAQPLIDRSPLAAQQGKADELDVISTVLNWWGGFKDEPLAVTAKIAAIEVVSNGLELTEREQLGGHTRALLLTTHALILLEDRYDRLTRDAGLDSLEKAEIRASYIDDVNQRARVFRRLALANWRARRPVKTLYYLCRAKTVPGIAADVKAKNRLFR